MNTLTLKSRTIYRFLQSTWFINSPSSSKPHAHQRYRYRKHSSLSEKVSVWSDIDDCSVPTGMHFDQPYPVNTSERQNETFPKIDDLSNNGDYSLVDDFKKHRRVPKNVTDLVTWIVERYPEGVSITELQNQLEMSEDVAVDKAYYGYGTLSRFVLVLPHLAMVEYGADGEMFLRPPPNDVSVAYCVQNSVVRCGKINVTKWRPPVYDEEDAEVCRNLLNQRLS